MSLQTYPDPSILEVSGPPGPEWVGKGRWTRGGCRGLGSGVQTSEKSVYVVRVGSVDPGVLRHTKDDTEGRLRRGGDGGPVKRRSRRSGVRNRRPSVRAPSLFSV